MPDITPQVEKILKTTKAIPLHTHNGTDSLKVSYKDLADLPTTSSTKVFSGAVDSSGNAISLPVGWASSRAGVGQYNISHNLNTANYSVVAIVISLNTRSLSANNIAANSFQIDIGNSGNTGGEDNTFNFIVSLFS